MCNCSCKIFLDVNNFKKNNLFLGVWLHFEKYFDHFKISRYFGHIIDSSVILASLEVSTSIFIIWKFWRYFGNF